MIRKVKGDILLSEAQAIAHGVAPHDHFNQGLALALRDEYPAMVKDFRHYCHLNNPHPGEAWLWAGPGRVVVNLLTQDPAVDEKSMPGKATTSHVRHALKELRKVISSQNIRSIALPKLATGVGGLSWKEVEPLIVKALGDLDIPIVIYETYVPGAQAAENLRNAA